MVPSDIQTFFNWEPIRVFMKGLSPRIGFLHGRAMDGYQSGNVRELNLCIGQGIVHADHTYVSRT